MYTNNDNKGTFHNKLYKSATTFRNKALIWYVPVYMVPCSRLNAKYRGSPVSAVLWLMRFHTIKGIALIEFALFIAIFNLHYTVDSTN
jgi:hypothetical protein